MFEWRERATHVQRFCARRELLDYQENRVYADYENMRVKTAQTLRELCVATVTTLRQ